MGAATAVGQAGAGQVPASTSPAPLTKAATVSHSRLRDYWLPVLAMLAFAGFGLWHAPVQPLWMDESFSLTFAQQPVADLLFALQHNVPSLPPYFLLLRAWEALAGPSVFAQRWPSAACGVVTAALLWQTARLLGGRGAAWVALALWLLQPEGFWYDQDVRMYAPLLLWATLAVWALVRALRCGRTGDWWLLSLAVLAALWTHYAGALLLAALTVVAVASACSRREAVRRVLWLGWPALTMLPWLLQLGMVDAVAFPEGSAWDQAFRAGRALLFGFGAPALPVALTAAAVVALALVLAAALLLDRGALRLVAALIALPYLLAGVVPPLHKLFSDRYLSFVTPLLALFGGLLIAAMWQRRRPVGALAALALTGVFATGLALVLAPDFHSWYNYPAATAYIRMHERPGQAVVESGGIDPTARYYYQQVDAGPLPVYTLPRYHHDSLDATEANAAPLAAGDGVWLVLDASGNFDGERVAERALTALYVPDGRWQFRDVTLRYFLTPRGLAQMHPLRPAPAFGGAIQLAGYGTMHADGQWSLSFAWHALRPVAQDYTVFVHLLDGSGRIVAQGDGPPDGGRQPTSGWQTGQMIFDLHRVALAAIPTGLQLEVGWYDPKTGRRLVSAPAAAGDALHLESGGAAN